MINDYDNNNDFFINNNDQDIYLLILCYEKDSSLLSLCSEIDIGTPLYPTCTCIFCKCLKCRTDAQVPQHATNKEP